MSGQVPFWKQRLLWTGLVGAAALAFWVVGIGAGWRAWILGIDGGIVAKAQQFGTDAHIWWIPATVLTLTAVMMGLGTAVVRHLAVADATGTPAEPAKETLPTLEARPTLEPVPEVESAEGRVEGEPDVAEDRRPDPSS